MQLSSTQAAAVSLTLWDDGVPSRRELACATM